ncbi:hypothetical protein MNEG_13392, partial [Monoraphidium neglectum]
MLTPRSVPREAPPGGPAKFTASDAEDLLAGVQRVFVLPPSATADADAPDAGGSGSGSVAGSGG